jgi:hypothetical protein
MIYIFNYFFLGKFISLEKIIMEVRMNVKNIIHP